MEEELADVRSAVALLKEVVGDDADCLSDAVETPFLVGGGCGKMEQWPLSVSFGGPYVRIRRINLA